MVQNGKALVMQDMHNLGYNHDLPAKVQTFACVIGVSSDWVIVAASENTSEMFGKAAEDLLGKSLSSVLQEETVHHLRSQSQVLSSEAPVLHIQSLALPKDDLNADVTVTKSGSDIFFEFEIAEYAPGLATGLEQIQRLVQRIASKTALEDAALEAARTVQILAGVDRVSVHRVGPNGLGPALGLSCRPPLNAEPGPACLRAHADNFCQHLHLTPNLRDLDAVLLRAAPDSGLKPDARCLCSYSPGEAFHTALSDEGVLASMTVPIRTSGALWGVFLCHHSEPMQQFVGRRSALALFSMLFGYEVQRLYERVGGHARAQALKVRDDLIGNLRDEPDIARAILAVQKQIEASVSHDGLAVWNLGTYQGNGQCLSQKEFEPVFAHLQNVSLGEVTTIDVLSDIGVTAAGLDADLTGMMAIPISMTERDFVLMFRQESGRDDRLQAWLGWEKDAGNALRSAILEAQLWRSEEHVHLGSSADAQNSLLVSELNHRVRNTLNLIRGMISQGRTVDLSTAEYAKELENRVFALARAHDQLTKLEWNWVSLKSMLVRELERFMRGGRAQVYIRGVDVELTPTAYTTLALVIHELTTNALKYGALSTDDGAVAIDVHMLQDGHAELTWVERGGAAVTSPGDPGFGMTIIRQSVPFELRGQSQATFEADGFEARFRLPPAHIRQQVDTSTVQSGVVRKTSEEYWAEMTIDGAAMILEDSLIIAIDAADLLRSAGATKVYSCNSVESAFKVLDEDEVSFALLDVNLGDETSLAVAEQLWSDGIPAVLATGYGNDQEMIKDFPPMPILTKPYDVSDLKEVLRSLRQPPEKAS